MPKAYRLIILAIFSFSLLQSKAEGKLVSGKDTGKSHPDTATHIGDHILKPIIGIGTGVLAYYGNVKPSNSYLQSPLIGRLGYDLRFAMKMTPVVEFNLYALFGTVAVDERSPTLNWSFQSEIRGGGFHFLFKILPKQAVTPYILVGFESFEFLSKVDLSNQYGQKYYYWSDGSIRNLPQAAANAASASILYQDYTYESDVRSMNLDGSGKYTEQTYAVPLGVGFMFKVGKKADFMIGTTLHYTFTDHIDGLTPDISAGPMKGTTYHDKFLFSSIMLRYDLTSAKNLKDATEKDEDRYEGVDFAALMNEDNDKDGVRDWDDSCAGTPAGAVVDKKGCPVDQDKDGVPDYRDKQEETPAGSIVNTDGVALTDSMMLRQYQMYVDSTGQFATVQIDSNGITGYHPKNTATNTTSTRYTVELGHFSKGVPADLMDKFLSVSDVKSNMMKDSSSVYTAGDYGDYNSAKARQEDLVKLGLTDAKVVYRKGDDFVTAEAPVNSTTNPTNVTTTNPENKTGTNPTNVTTTTNPENKTGTNPTKTGTNPTNVTTTTNPENKTTTNPSNGAIVYRVQLGAYRHKLSKNIYSDVSDIVEIKTENGFYTYSSGAFTNYQDAANHKAKLITQGFTDAFIKAYQNGKRIPLEKAGAIYVKPEKEDMSEQPSKEQITMDKSQISFKVQVGAFKGTPPANLQAVYKLYSNLTIDRDENGINHYLVGPYADYKSAKDMKAEAEASGAKGAFVVAYFKGKPIPVSEAMDILSK